MQQKEDKAQNSMNWEPKAKIMLWIHWEALCVALLKLLSSNLLPGGEVGR